MRSTSQAHDRYDDGLVHNHNWATTDTFGATTTSEGTPFTRAFTGSIDRARSQDYSTRAQEPFDDGLVHNHDWAVTGK
jgi:hypothetical protein